MAKAVPLGGTLSIKVYDVVIDSSRMLVYYFVLVALSVEKGLRRCIQRPAVLCEESSKPELQCDDGTCLSTATLQCTYSTETLVPSLISLAASWTTSAVR